MNAVATYRSFSDTLTDTSFFQRALAHVHKLWGNPQPFFELPLEQRCAVLRLSQQFKLGLDICEGCDQWGRGANVDSMDCSEVGTIYDLKSERILCARHFEENQ